MRPNLLHGGNRVATAKTWDQQVQVHYVSRSTGEHSDTHSLLIGYIFWLFGFTGAHRFYFGKTATGILWFFTLGLLGIGWLVDLFLIPSMEHSIEGEFQEGPIDYSLAWVLLIFTGWLGLHRFYQEKYITGVIYLLTGGLLGLGVVFDVLTLNDQVSEENMQFTYVVGSV